MGDDSASDLGVFDDLVEKRERERSDGEKDQSFKHPGDSDVTKVDRPRPPSLPPGAAPDGKSAGPPPPLSSAAASLKGSAAPPPPPPPASKPKASEPEIEPPAPKPAPPAADTGPVHTLTGLGKLSPPPPPPPASPSAKSIPPKPPPPGSGAGTDPALRPPPAPGSASRQPLPPPPAGSTAPRMKTSLPPPPTRPPTPASVPSLPRPAAPIRKPAASLPKASLPPPPRSQARLPPPPQAPRRGREWNEDASSHAARVRAQPGVAAERRSRLVPILGGLAAVAFLAVVAFLLMPKVGTLIITVSGPNGSAVDGAKVLVDGELTCEGSPCRIEGIAAGAHTVRVEAPGYARPADRAVVIKSGADEVVDFALPRGSSSASADGSTGIRVGSLGKDLRLFVDGKDRGELPLTLDDVEPGRHTVRIAGGSVFETYEEQVELREGQMLELNPKLKTKPGRVTVAVGKEADGAAVVLVCGDEKQLLLDLPKTVEFDPNQNCRVEATKEGYEPFSAAIKLGEGESETTVRVALAEADQGKSRGGTARRGGSRATAGGSITCNSIPASNVLLDGRPIGRTPKRVKVAAGRHSVMFMHPTKGRRSVGVTVRPGKNAIAAVRF